MNASCVCGKEIVLQQVFDHAMWSHVDDPIKVYNMMVVWNGTHTPSPVFEAWEAR